MAQKCRTGHFAGSFLSAFTAAQQARDERERNKKEIAARLKLVEIQMRREQQANAAAATQQTRNSRSWSA